MTAGHKINVTVVTGFLGAGKTTFINAILKEYPDTQFAIVENEIGEVTIDTKLIRGIDLSKMFELKQGCICCTISDEYELILIELAERFPNVQHLIVETTGIADPAGVLYPFFQNNEIKNRYHLRQTVTVVDFINFEGPAFHEISMKQIVVADTIIISKIENIAEQPALEFSQKIKKINPQASIRFMDENISDSFDLQGFASNTHQKIMYPEITHAGIQTKLISIKHPLHRREFENWLTYILDINQNKIFRTKGILCFENELYEHILQGVAKGFEIIEGDSFVSSDISQIVFIGLELSQIDFSY